MTQSNFSEYRLKSLEDKLKNISVKDGDRMPYALRLIKPLLSKELWNYIQFMSPQHAKELVARIRELENENQTD